MDSSGDGRVFLVGAGPGDPGLLTLRAAELLERADVLLYDALASDAVVALARASCQRVFVGKRAGAHAMPQAEIERLAIEHARAGARVVRLKGGDPFVFGRGGEEAQALAAAGIPFEIAPGVSSAYAAPAYAGIPVTHRAHAAAFTVATGHEDPAKAASTLDYSKLADPGRTLILLMATANPSEITGELVANGLAPQTPVAVVQDGTRPSQRTVTGTLATICNEVARAQIGAPAVVVVGSVVELRSELRWFDTGALFGKRVLITRAGTQSAAFARALLARGAEPITAPAIAIEAIEDARALDGALAALASYSWIVFTSQNGVDAFFARLAAQGADARRIGSTKVAAIGDRTAERLRSNGVVADLVPPAFVGEEIARALVARTVPADRVLLCCAQEARDVLPRMLEEAGLRVDVVAGYRTVIPKDNDFAGKVARANVLTFTSASTVRGFVQLLGDSVTPAQAASGKCVACIGPITANAAAQAGLKVDVVASVFTTEGLLNALESCFAPQNVMAVALGALFAAAIAFAAYRARSLSFDGALAAFAVGTIVFGSARWSGAAILLAFFVPSVLLTRVGRERKMRLAGAQEGKARKAWQVLANGAVAALCALAAVRFGAPFQAAFAGAFAAAAADTWGTEIGTLARERPVSILTFRPIETGLSGGVTLRGSAATIAGALCVAAVASLVRFAPLLAVAIGGVAGALLDSLLGASLQALRWCPRCECECETSLHRCGTTTTMRRGIGWFQNDAVNFCATLGGALVAALVAR